MEGRTHMVVMVERNELHTPTVKTRYIFLYWYRTVIFKENVYTAWSWHTVIFKLTWQFHMMEGLPFFQTTYSWYQTPNFNTKFVHFKQSKQKYTKPHILRKISSVKTCTLQSRQCTAFLHRFSYKMGSVLNENLRTKVLIWSTIHHGYQGTSIAWVLANIEWLHTWSW